MPFNNSDQISARRANVARLYLKGWTQAAIAVEENVTQGQVSQDLVEIRTEWKVSMVFDFNEAKGKELAKLDAVEAELWEAWAASKKPLKKKYTKMRGLLIAEKDKDKQLPKDLETTETTEERLGDPRYMEGILRCIQKRVEILGLDAPQKIQVEEKNLPFWLTAVKPKASLN